MDKLGSLFIIFFIAFLVKLNGQEPTFCHTHFLGNIDVRTNNLIFMPRIKGAGEHAYLFEIDDKKLGILFWSWTSKAPYTSELTKAYMWNSKRWRKVKSDMIKHDRVRGSSLLSFYGDFGNLKDICVVYDDDKTCNSRPVDDFDIMVQKYGLKTTYLKERDYRSYRIRNFFRFW